MIINILNMIPLEIKKVLDENFDMIVLATKKLNIPEEEFDVRFEEILSEVNRMQIDTYNKLTTRKDLLNNATDVLGSKVWLNNQIRNCLEKIR